ncbi:hypothetical protein NQZ68_003580 [Dissostichus eleginoides]|nr:hypothetical protein NQZ68_003580 [Dissostichus eleginoides]
MHHRSILQLGMKNRMVITTSLWETKGSLQEKILSESRGMKLINNQTRTPHVPQNPNPKP